MRRVVFMRNRLIKLLSGKTFTTSQVSTGQLRTIQTRTFQIRTRQICKHQTRAEQVQPVFPFFFYFDLCLAAFADRRHDCLNILANPQWAIVAFFIPAAIEFGGRSQGYAERGTDRSP